jgi:hypothetical protein
MPSMQTVIGAAAQGNNRSLARRRVSSMSTG